MAKSWPRAVKTPLRASFGESFESMKSKDQGAPCRQHDVQRVQIEMHHATPTPWEATQSVGRANLVETESVRPRNATHCRRPAVRARNFVCRRADDIRGAVLGGLRAL